MFTLAKTIDSRLNARVQLLDMLAEIRRRTRDRLLNQHVQGRVIILIEDIASFIEVYRKTFS